MDSLSKVLEVRYAIILTEIMLINYSIDAFTPLITEDATIFLREN